MCFSGRPTLFALCSSSLGGARLLFESSLVETSPRHLPVAVSPSGDSPATYSLLSNLKSQKGTKWPPVKQDCPPAQFQISWPASLDHRFMMVLDSASVLSPSSQRVAELSGQAFDRGSAVSINPQPLPPREAYALALADAHIQELVSLHRAGALLGGEVAERALGQSLRQIADIDELCPRWPKWPFVWPPPPPPPWEIDEEMSPTELFLFGSRFMAAAGLVKQENLQNALASLGGKALTLGTEKA